MKYRLDFVTNSSSSSFVCYGVCRDEINIPNEVYLRMFNEYVEEYPKYSPTPEEIVTMSDEDKINFVKDEVDEYASDIFGDFEYDDSYVGLSPNSIIARFPDEKIGDIKSLVAKEFNKILGTNFTEKDIKYIEEVDYNG